MAHRLVALQELVQRRDEGVSVSGGFVYRGDELRQFRGRYIFGGVNYDTAPLDATGALTAGVDPAGATQPSVQIGKQVTLKTTRGQVMETPMCRQTLVTTHPAAVLRNPDPEASAAAYRAWIAAFAEGIALNLKDAPELQITDTRRLDRDVVIEAYPLNRPTRVKV